MTVCQAVIRINAAHFTVAPREWKAKSTLWGQWVSKPSKSFCT